MKYSKALLVSALVAMSGAAFAQAGGGNGNGGTGSGNAHGAATAGPTVGGEPASGAMSSGTSKMHHMSKTKSKMKKPMNDTTNTPGADASSDTKGQ
jgi:hypothetical protein